MCAPFDLALQFIYSSPCTTSLLLCHSTCAPHCLCAHTLRKFSVQYPGPCGWTKEYGSARIANIYDREEQLSKVRAEHRDDKWRRERVRYYSSDLDAWRVGRHVQYVYEMRRFTDMAQRAREFVAVLEEGGRAEGAAAAVEDELLWSQDANWGGEVRQALEEILGPEWEWRSHGTKRGWWELEGGRG